MKPGAIARPDSRGHRFGRYCHLCAVSALVRGEIGMLLSRVNETVFLLVLFAPRGPRCSFLTGRVREKAGFRPYLAIVPGYGTAFSWCSPS